MAHGSSDDGAENGDVELEAMRKDNFSWHPCQVSLRSIGLSLIVRFGNSYLEETIADKEEVLARVRARSSPLQGDDCSSIQRGDHVLASKNSDAKSIFYDAQVEEAIQVRHSKRTHCRCSFTIKWLHQSLEGEVLTVPATAIMKLTGKSVNLHPTVSGFLNMLQSSNGIGALPVSTAVDDMDCEMDINVLLERQIKEINNTSNVTAKKVSHNIVFGLKVDLKEPCHDTEADESSCDITPLCSNLKRSNGSESIEIRETHPAFNLPIQEEIKASRSPLNPLAARAALASSKLKFPQTSELSHQIYDERGVITAESGIFSAVGRSSVTNPLSLKIAAASDGKNVKYEGVVKTLFPTLGFSEIAEFSNAPSRAQVKGMSKKNKNSEKKITQLSETRFTRKQVQRSSQITETNETQLGSSSQSRRVTRSTVVGAEKIELKEANNATEENMSSKFAKLNSRTQNIPGPQNLLSDNKKPGVSPSDSEKSTLSLEIENGILKKDYKVDSQKGAIVEDAARNNPSKRLTRSGLEEEAENSNFKDKLPLKKGRFCKLNEVDLMEENVTLKSNMLVLEKTIHSPGATKITDEKVTKRKTLIPVKTTPKSSETLVSGSTQGTKKKFASSIKQETRSSPRLNLLPRTRSQKKA